MLGWAFLFIYNNTMKFVQTLLESYFRLNEEREDVIGAITAKGNGLGNGDGSRNPITPPNGGSTGQVGLNDKGVAFLEGGPLAGFTKANVNSVSQGTLTILQNWWDGKEKSEQPGPGEQGNIPRPFGPSQFPNQMHPVIEGLSDSNRNRVMDLEKRVPGITEKLLSIHENAKNLLHREFPGGTRRKSRPFVMTEGMLIGKIFGGHSLGSIAFLIEKELDEGDKSVMSKEVKNGKPIISFHLDDNANLSQVLESFQAMVDLSEAFDKSWQDCEKAGSHDAQIQTAKNVVKDTKTGAFFFRTDVHGVEGGAGVSLSIAEQNPINLMAQMYNDNLDWCDQGTGLNEDSKIKEMDIAKEEEFKGGSYANTVKDVSEILAVAHFDMWDAHRLLSDDPTNKVGKEKYKKALDQVADLLIKHGLNAFDVIESSEAIANGKQASTPETRDAQKFWEDLLDTNSDGQLSDKEKVLGRTKDDKPVTLEAILNAVNNTGGAMLRVNLEYLSQIKPDFVVRVGNTAPKGDKSDVDYVFKTEPADGDKPEGTVGQLMKFDDLEKDVQDTIDPSGENHQDEYWVIRDSLKMYLRNGDVKLGTSTNTDTEAGRLLDPEDPHGKFIKDALRPDGAVKQYEEDWKGAEELLKEVQAATSKIDELLPVNDAGLKKVANDTKIIGKHFRTVFASVNIKGQNKKTITTGKDLPKDTGTMVDQSAFVDSMLKKYEEGAEHIKKGKDGGADVKVEENYKKSMQSAVALMKRTTQGYILKKNIKYNKDGTPNKKNPKTRAALTAFAALMASTGMDSTGGSPQSTIHILKTGNPDKPHETHRGNQNEMIRGPLRELLDENSSRSVNVGVSKFSITDDGSWEQKAGRHGHGASNMYINTNHL